MLAMDVIVRLNVMDDLAEIIARKGVLRRYKKTSTYQARE